MKKTFTLSLILAVGFTAAQARTLYLLDTIEEFDATATAATDPESTKTFEYDDLQRLIKSTDDSGMFLRFEYTYNDKNQVVERRAYQDFDGAGVYNLKTRIEFEYNDDNTLKALTTWNYMKADLTKPVLGGSFVWAYDNQGRIALRTMYFDEAREEAQQETQYFYNEAGQLERVDDRVFDLATQGWKPSGRCVYEYDSKGRMVTECSGTLDGNFNFTPKRYEEYVWSDDDNNNLEEVYTTGPARRTKQSSHLYTYDEIPASDVVFPRDLTDEMLYKKDHYNLMSHRPVTDDFQSSTDSGMLLPLFNYVYRYTEVEVTGIDNVVVPDVDVIVANVNGDVLTLGGFRGNENVAIYDLNGRSVLTARPAGNTLDVSALQQGVYVVSTPHGVAKFTR